MNDSRRTLSMPNHSAGKNPIIDINHDGVIVIVGANGSGKSRLGAWIENKSSLTGQQFSPTTTRTAYRIGAHRNLHLPNVAQRTEIETARRNLQDGSEMGSSTYSRIQGDPVVGQTQDFGTLLTALFAERVKNATDYREKGIETGGNQGKPLPDALENLASLWNSIFKERRLVVADHSINARSIGQADDYSASSLSDGERVGFYLMGQVLLAPRDSTIVIDEPELHLHPSIQALLWDNLEQSRSDCTFIYITHDLTFAASRRRAKIIVLTDYCVPSKGPDDQGQPSHQRPVGRWIWQLAPSVTGVPSDVVLKIMGSRRETLFVEGKTGSIDSIIYPILFPGHHVIHGGSCHEVEKAVRSFRMQKNIHHLNVQGIIDRDDRSTAQMAKLKMKGVHTLPVAAVENILALPICTRAFLESRDIDAEQIDELIGKAETSVREHLRSVMDWAIAEQVQYTLRREFQRINRTKGEDNIEGIIEAVKKTTSRIDPGAIFISCKAEFESSLDSTGSFLDLLRKFRNKGILGKIASIFGTTEDKYRNELLDLISRMPELRKHLRSMFDIPDVHNQPDDNGSSVIAAGSISEPK